MDYVDLHAHMVSRTTDDYHGMARSGCRLVTEPAFWAGYDRGSAAAFRDYFDRLTGFEPRRAAQYGIGYYAWICLNPKEAEDRRLAREVLELIPAYLEHERVIGVGEIGLNRVTVNELETFEEHLDLAARYRQLALVHTPHLEDKYKGTRIIVDCVSRRADISREKVLIDHAEEHTIEMILEAGFWAGLTLYPRTKVSGDRAVDMIERFGPDRICVSSACDWGPSNSLAVPDFILSMRARGHSDALIRKLVYENPLEFLAASGKPLVPVS